MSHALWGPASVAAPTTAMSHLAVTATADALAQRGPAGAAQRLRAALDAAKPA